MLQKYQNSRKYPCDSFREVASQLFINVLLEMAHTTSMSKQDMPESKDQKQRQKERKKESRGGHTAKNFFLTKETWKGTKK